MQHIIMPLKMSHPIFEKIRNLKKQLKISEEKKPLIQNKRKKNYEAVTKGLPFPVIRSAQMKL